LNISARPGTFMASRLMGWKALPSYGSWCRDPSRRASLRGAYPLAKRVPLLTGALESLRQRNGAARHGGREQSLPHARPPRGQRQSRCRGKSAGLHHAYHRTAAAGDGGAAGPARVRAAAPCWISQTGISGCWIPTPT